MARRFLVTGGSRGIGRAIAERLASDGFEIVLNYRSQSKSAEDVAETIRRAGGRAALLPFDVSDREQTAARLLNEIQDAGPFYGIVSNAGIRRDGPFPGLSGEAWDQVLRTNLDGFYNVTQPLLMPMIRARQGGRIVTMSSVSGLVGNRGQVNYSASKAGLIGATRSLALELAKREITVNCVAPGLIETEMIEGLSSDVVKQLIPMRRLGQPREVAALVSFLCSKDASYITGQVFSINGGLA
ncbi:MAG: 3-oxoacyl-ACP reductase FabG [Myxococcales bacterium]|nr:3-oxoacyl-ACP reductase FabG [Myxococcales bacterium]